MTLKFVLLRWTSPTHVTAHLIFTTGISILSCSKLNSSSYSLKPIPPSFFPLSVPDSSVLLTQHTILGMFFDTSLFFFSSLSLSNSSANPEIDPDSDPFSPPPPLPFLG